MKKCPRCSKGVEANWAYCPSCGRPRVLESLRESVAQPVWQRQAWEKVTVLVLLWLTVTIGVAFLREARAVRLSRALLAEGKLQEAWDVLHPFQQKDPAHRQALFLCGKITLRLGLSEDSKRCLQQLDQLSPELAKELRQDFGGIVTEQTRDQGCNAEALAARFVWASELGEDMVEKVIQGLDGVIAACRAEQNAQSIFLIVKMLDERGRAQSIVDRGYVPSIESALAEARYQDAEALAREAIQLVPEGREPVEAALMDVRQKVAATVATLRQYRNAFAAEAEHRVDGYWCFPGTAPAALLSARDGWGNALLYEPLGRPYETRNRRECYGGFAVVSYGSDGVETENNWNRSPNAEISCRFVFGSESCILPDQFWRPKQ